MHRTLRIGDEGEDVLALEEFLANDGYYWVEADGKFDPDTEEAVKSYQRDHSLDDDGVVGKGTWANLAYNGFHIDDDGSTDRQGPNWPPKPANLKPLSGTERDKKFGHIAYVPAPSAGNPEGIRVTNNWAAEHLVTVVVPQLKEIPGVPVNGRLVGRVGERQQVHKLAAESFKQLWRAWEDEGRLQLVLTWGGLYSPRFIRGSRSVLSNHAYATAFDINVPWNGLRHTPALVGKKGSVRELVAAANRLGWYWGGHFGRVDGMHFEYVGE